MNYNLFNQLETLSGSPFISFKCEGVPIIGDLIGAGASMYNTETTNNTNARNVAKTNEMNYQIAQEANQLSQQQFQTNLNWLKQQYFGNQHREDTRYQRMVQDMMSAGLNPALQNGQPSSVSSVGAPSPSQFHVAQMEAAHYDPMSFDPLTSGLSNAINSFFQNKKTVAETDKIMKDSQTTSINNQTLMLENVARITNIIATNEKLMADKDVSKATRDKLMTENAYLNEQLDILKKQAPALSVQPEKQNKLLDAQEINTKENTNLAIAQQQAVQSGIQLSAVQAKAIAQSIEESVKRVKRDDDYYTLSAAEVRNRVIGYVYDQAEKFERVGMDKEMMSSQKFKNYVGSVADGIGVGLGVYSASKPKGAKGQRPPSMIAPEYYDTWTMPQQ